MTKSLFSLLQIFVLLVFVACSSIEQQDEGKKIQKAPAPQANASVQKEFAHAKIELNKNPEKALKIFENIIKKYPNTQSAADSLRVVGDYYYRNKKYTSAINAYSYILNSEYKVPYEGQIYIRSVHLLLETNERAKARGLVDQGLRFEGLSSDEKIELLKYRLGFQKELQDHMGELETLAKMYNLSTKDQEKISFRVRANGIVDSFIRPQDLNAVLTNPNLEFVQANIHYRLGNVAFEQSNFSEARAHFSQVVSLNPNSELAESAKDFLKQIDARSNFDPRTIGVILPLSGKYADIGRSALNSIQLALGIYDKSSSLRLSVIDSEGRFTDPRRAVEKLVVDDHVVAIIGSLQSKTASAIASRAQALGVPTIVLSQKSGITQIGDFVFRNALTSEMQVHALVQTATQKLGYSRFAILYPDDPYGNEYANLFWDEVEKAGGQIRAAQSYDPKETDFRIAIEKLVGTYYKDDRKAEYKLKLDEWTQKNIKTSARKELPKDLLAPIVDFQAVFIPDSIRALGQISAMFTFQDVKDIALLGTNLWNTSGVIARAGQFANSLLFVDSFLNQDQTFLQSNFYKSFTQNFGRTPSLYDLQAYDTAIILKNTLGGISSRAELQSRLSQVHSLNGALSSMSSEASRDFSRPIEALSVSDGKILRLDEIKK